MARRLLIGWLACGVVACGAFGAHRVEAASHDEASSRAAATRSGQSAGRTIWLRDCAVCHGADARGGAGGPDISDRGTAAVDFMVTTGRMPLPSPSAALERRKSPYTAAQQQALIDYASTLVTGPHVPNVDTEGADLTQGGVAYRQNCATCHQSAGGGGALAFGDNAPDL
ncbi:MAG TPA: c-type cytochrome, partial [Acidimicrobiales bacterium]|nr:c-type cytochrome [Acidimicrobiales bacterium]